MVFFFFLALIVIEIRRMHLNTTPASFCGTFFFCFKMEVFEFIPGRVQIIQGIETQRQPDATYFSQVNYNCPTSAILANDQGQ